MRANNISPATSAAEPNLSAALPPDPGTAQARARPPVQYRSSALADMDPGLVASVDPREIAQCPAIQKAHLKAEAVRESYKRRGSGGPIALGSECGVVKPGTEDAEKAGRYDRRLKMNRKSAAASRVRREAYIKALEVELTSQDRNGRQLKEQLIAEREANARLRDLLAERQLSPAVPPEEPAVAPPAPRGAQVAEITADTLYPAPTLFDGREQPDPTVPDQFASALNSGARAPADVVGVGGPHGVLQPMGLDEVFGDVKLEPQPLSASPNMDALSEIDFVTALLPLSAVDPECPSSAIEDILSFSVDL